LASRTKGGTWWAGLCRWISGKSEAQRGKILVGVVKERRQILIVQQRRKSAVESRFEVEIEMNGSSRGLGRAQIPRDRTAPSKETKEPSRGGERRKGGKEG
jgi:hypothetical protein